MAVRRGSRTAGRLVLAAAAAGITAACAETPPPDPEQLRAALSAEDGGRSEVVLERIERRHAQRYRLHYRRDGRPGLAHARYVDGGWEITRPESMAMRFRFL